MNDTSVAKPRRCVWPLFLLGVLLCIAGPGLYAGQLALRHLWTPWYVPVLASAGVLLMLVSVLRRPGLVRVLGLLLFGLLCGLEWYFLGVASKSPPYAGPAIADQRVPPFAASRADGTAFTQENLSDGTSSVLVFFRGRW
jgi:hypothetical protein